RVLGAGVEREDAAGERIEHDAVRPSTDGDRAGDLEGCRIEHDDRVCRAGGRVALAEPDRHLVRAGDVRDVAHLRIVPGVEHDYMAAMGKEEVMARAVERNGIPERVAADG